MKFFPRLRLARAAVRMAAATPCAAVWQLIRPIFADFLRLRNANSVPMRRRFHAQDKEGEDFSNEEDAEGEDFTAKDAEERREESDRSDQSDRSDNSG